MNFLFCLFIFFLHLHGGRYSWRIWILLLMADLITVIIFSFIMLIIWIIFMVWCLHILGFLITHLHISIQYIYILLKLFWYLKILCFFEIFILVCLLEILRDGLLHGAWFIILHFWLLYRGVWINSLIMCLLLRQLLYVQVLLIDDIILPSN